MTILQFDDSHWLAVLSEIFSRDIDSKAGVNFPVSMPLDLSSVYIIKGVPAKSAISSLRVERNGGPSSNG